MSDVFLSYAQQDREKAEAVAAALQACGWSVWMDTALHAGSYWDESIESAMRDAKCVVVLWSGTSVESHWVRTEAEHAREQQKLVPARLDDAKVPIGFRRVHTASLVGWTGSASHTGFEGLAEGVRARVEGTEQPKRSAGAGHRQSTWRRVAFSVVVSLPLWLALIALVALRTETEVDLQVKASGVTFTPRRAQELLDLLVVLEVSASGFQEVQIPRARGRPERIFRKSDAMPNTIQFSLADPLDRGAITLAPLSIPAGTRTSIRSNGAHHQLRIVSESGRVPVTVNVKDRVVVRLSASPAEVLDFGSPKPATIDSGEGGLDLSLVPAGPVQDVLVSSLPIDNLSLLAIEERNASERTAIREVSTILAGTLTIDSHAGGSRKLTRGEKIAVDDSAGLITELRLDGDALSLSFRGRVKRVSTCNDDMCTDLTPTWAGWLWTRHQALMLIAGVVYFGLLMWAGLQLRGRRHRG